MIEDSTPPAEPVHCCLFRLSALGDISHVIPVVRALRRTYPDWRLSWVIGATYWPLVRDLDDIDWLVYDKHAGPRAFLHFVQRLRRQHFALLLQMQTSLRANVLAAAIRAERRIGWDRRRSREGHALTINERVQESPPQHQVQGFLAFARHLGCATAEPQWDLPVSAAARRFAAEVLPGEQPVLLISPCSSRPARDWPTMHYAAVARFAIETLGLRVLVCGDRQPRARRAGAEIAAAHPAVIDLSGRDTLDTLLGLLARAAIVLGPDSGPLHLANALGKPVIGLYAATPSARSGPYHSLDLCVDRYDQAARRFLGRPATALRWGRRLEFPGVMELITVDDVIARLRLAAGRLNRFSN